MKNIFLQRVSLSRQSADSVWRGALLVIIAVLVTACGGGGGSSAAPSSNPSAATGTTDATGTTGTTDATGTTDSTHQSTGHFGDAVDQTTQPPTESNTPVDLAKTVLLDPIPLPPAQSDIEKALLTGDATALNDLKLVAQHMQYYWQEKIGSNIALIKNIIGDTVPEYDPNKKSALPKPSNIKTSHALIVGDKGNTLASISMANKGRGVAYGSSILSDIQKGEHAKYLPSLKRVLAWLVNGDPAKNSTSTIKVAWAGGVPSVDGLLALGKAGVKAETIECGSLPTPACLKGVDLLIFGGTWTETPAKLDQFIKTTMSSGTPVLYVHTNGRETTDIARNMLREMDLVFDNEDNGNYYREDKVSANRTLEANNTLTNSSINKLLGFVQKIAANALKTDYDWSKCTRPYYSCDVVGFDAFDAELKALKLIFDDFNYAGINIFTTPDMEPYRYLALWADVVRKQRTFPVNNVTNPIEWNKSMVADAIVPVVRPTATTNENLGSFMRPANSQVARSTSPEDITVTLGPKEGFTAIGRLALPGKPLTIEVLEAGDAKVSVHFNTLRDSSTKYRGQTSYDRPRWLKGGYVSLVRGQPKVLTSPYGGTLQLKFDNAAPNQTVKLRVTGVAKHPFFDLTQPGYDAQAFAALVKQDVHDWIEVKVPGFEVHSYYQNFSGKLKEQFDNNIVQFVTEIKEYLVDDLERVIGYFSDAAPHSDHVKATCSKLGWDCTNKTLHTRSASGFIQHANADKWVSSADGSAGNPYDLNGSYSPRSWGASHEIGHTLQKQHLNIYDLAESNASIETSNNIFPLHKFWDLSHKGIKDPEGLNNSAKQVLEILKASQAQANPIAAAYDSIWKDVAVDHHSQRLVFYSQWPLYFTVKHAALGSTAKLNESRGWDVYPLLYLHQRLFDATTAATWLDNRVKLGYSQYAVKPTVNGNDNMLIVLSLLSERDQRPTFDLWGITYTPAASAQVDSFKYTKEPAFFYASKTRVSDQSTAKKLTLPATNWVWPSF